MQLIYISKKGFSKKDLLKLALDGQSNILSIYLFIYLFIYLSISGYWLRLFLLSLTFTD